MMESGAPEGCNLRVKLNKYRTLRPLILDRCEGYDPAAGERFNESPGLGFSKPFLYVWYQPGFSAGVS